MLICSDVLNLGGAGTPGLGCGVMPGPSEVGDPLLVTDEGFVVGGVVDVVEVRRGTVDEVGFEVADDDDFDVADDGFDVANDELEEAEDDFEDTEDDSNRVDVIVLFAAVEVFAVKGGTFVVFKDNDAVESGTDPFLRDAVDLTSGIEAAG